MINAVIAIELEVYLEHDGQIDVVHDQGQPVNGYALYLRYENERGDALAQWLCDHPDHHWPNPVRHPTSHQLPHSTARLHHAHLGGLNTANQACGHTPFSNPLTKNLAYPAASHAVG
jgi:hypothetical protein